MEQTDSKSALAGKPVAFRRAFCLSGFPEDRQENQSGSVAKKIAKRMDKQRSFRYDDSKNPAEAPPE
ncbi:MAG: hypothetical protein HFE80_11865 [Clostridiaceae bacterium]|nr:hypothetical protein [Clostridiaceae bacterium]